jgi:hypothetical protein
MLKRGYRELSYVHCSKFFKTFHFEASAGGVKWLAIAIFSYYEPYKRSIGDALRR